MYQEHIVAFIDLLGFSNSIREKSFEEVDTVLTEFNKQLYEFDQFSNSMLSSFRFKQRYGKLEFFSDCAVWAYPVEKIKVPFSNTLESIVLSFSQLQYWLYDKNIVARGGISIGDLYFDETKVFGNALVKAAELEKLADFPRILLDKDLVERSEIPFTTSRYLRSILSIEESQNGSFYYINLVNHINSVILSFKEGSIDLRDRLDQNLLQYWIGALTKVTVDGLKHSDKRVRRKYEWLHSKLLSLEKL